MKKINGVIVGGSDTKEAEMKALEKLDSHLKTRLSDLSKAKERGRKIIGYAAGSYLPEELWIVAT